MSRNTRTLLILTLLGIKAPCLAQQPDLGKYVGVRICRNCHESPERFPIPDEERHAILKEYPTWKNEDKHSQAYELLLSPESKSIAAKLQLASPAHESMECLSCHSMEWLPEPRRGRFFEARVEGVTCDGCHGPGSKWFNLHTEEDWYEKTPEEKEAFGMIDVNNPIKRARVCLSCHLGNPDEGKTMEHRFYAAGHPPLPAFELDTFCQSMPSHWFGPRTDAERKARLRAVAASSWAILAESSRLVGKLASSDKWPDYAQFDCYGCHHELKKTSWRRDRIFKGRRPGRPMVMTWPFEVLPSQGSESVNALLLEFADASTTKPFGDSVRIARTAEKIAVAAEAEAVRILKGPLTERDLLQVLKKACTPAEIRDYQAARQLSWTIRSSLGALGATRPSLLNDPQLRGALDGLNQQLGLQLPAGRQASVTRTLPQRLQLINNYDAHAFNKRLEQLAKALPQ